MALHVLAYNIKRVIAILGVPTLIEAIRASSPHSWPHSGVHRTGDADMCEVTAKIGNSAPMSSGAR
jgi:hypothetical protein